MLGVKTTRVKVPIAGMQARDFESRHEFEAWRYQTHLRADELAVRSALRDWLKDMDWSKGWAVHHTFPAHRQVRQRGKPISKPDKFVPNTQDYCRRVLQRRVVVPWSTRLYGKRWRRRGRSPYGVWIWERKPSSHLHVHGFMNGMKDTRRMDFVDYCAADELLGWARAFPVNDDEIDYAVKYVTKRPESWELFGSHRMWLRAMPPLVGKLDQAVRECDAKRPLCGTQGVTGGTR